MELLSIVWEWDPTFVMLGELDIRWYGLMWAVGILLAERIIANVCKREGLPKHVVESGFAWIVLGTFIGARVGHCLFYEPEVYLPEPWRIITDIRDGGMASHGATIGIMISILGFVRRNHLPFVWGIDRIAIVAPLAGAIIRFGNLFNSEIVGKVTDVPWGFQFVRYDAPWAVREYSGDGPEALLADIPARHPAQLYEAMCYLLTFALLVWLYYRKDVGRRRPGILFGVSMIGIFLTRFFIEFIKERQVDFESGMALDMGQLLSIPFILFGVFMIVRAMRRPEVSDLGAVVEYANSQFAAKRKAEENKKRRDAKRRK